MEDTYKLAKYWGERFRRYGHTGWADELIYAYDQSLRLKAIDKALTRAKVAVSSVTHVLDVGCGTGDLVLEFAKKGAVAAKIIYLLQNGDKRREFGQANRQVIEERNNREREMGKMEKLYNELIERYRR